METEQGCTNGVYYCQGPFKTISATRMLQHIRIQLGLTSRPSANRIPNLLMKRNVLIKPDDEQ